MLLEVKDFSISLRGSERMLLDHLSFCVKAGDSFQFLGMSGSGKTTLCNALFRALDSSVFHISGQILYQGHDLFAMDGRMLRKVYGSEIIYISQNPMTAFDPSMRVGKQLQEVLRMHDICSTGEAKQRVLCSMAAANLPDPKRVYNSFPYQLSGGMLQRVLFAMTLMTEARLVIADEPTTALDAQLRVSTIESLREMKRRGTAVVMMTHDFRSAMRLGGDAAILQEGRMIETASVEKLLREPSHPHTKALVHASVLEECG